MKGKRKKEMAKKKEDKTGVVIEKYSITNALFSVLYQLNGRKKVKKLLTFLQGVCCMFSECGMKVIYRIPF